MKVYKITAVVNGTIFTKVIFARNRREALQYAWGTLNLDDVYVEELKDEQAETD